jgi:hypothetical protein
MSSAVISTSAALGRPFLFDAEPEPEVYSPFSDSKKPPGTHESPITRVLQSTIKNQKSAIPLLIPASRLDIRPAPEMVSSGVPAIDALTGGLPRGCLTEICGPASSGRTTLLLAALAAVTRRGEFCVVVDASDALDPHSAAAAGVDLDRLLWVRCGEDFPQKKNSPRRHRDTETQIKNRVERTKYQSEHRLEQVLRATDLLLESGGFGLIVLDLADVPLQAARRIPLTTWFRFRRAVENKPTILLAIEQHPIAGSCSSLILQLAWASHRMQAAGLAAERRKNAAHGASRGSAVKSEQAPEGRKNIHISVDSQIAVPAHAQLLTGLEITAELILSRLDRKPAHSVTFGTKTAWAG